MMPSPVYSRNHTMHLNGVPVDLGAFAGDLRLEFDPRGARDSWSEPPHRFVASSQDGHLFDWTIPLAPMWWDPIYAESSAWSFRVVPEAENPAGLSPAYVDGHITVEIIKSS